ncbi:membrane-fusion protein [Magnetococcus marinus MC-1]|uniref:Membrane-fusion protein n=1 Tax=Magnetococcus marinus (strain ATCC BAA-1437 / JCM 17883 / MC-1) TaxID=156889 RepID=A0L4Q1_MAGMM|nr:HlyD family efflux transporter periplasmic adaptor subunit [Magnetococcus marinus]ABK42944.1 membrane-fusion protein [Magnetococcus marinus MC-1]
MSDNPLVALLGLEELARKAVDSAALGFVMVNDSRRLALYRQAALYIDGEGLKAVSGVTGIEKGAPFTLWLQRLLKRFAAEDVRQLGPHDMEGSDRQEWSEWLPSHALLLPLAERDGKRLGVLLLAREEAWSEQEVALLTRAADFYGHAWSVLHRPSRWVTWKSGLMAIPKWPLKLAVVMVVALCIPVRLSVLAPAEVVPHNPAVIRSPMDGVIQRVHVRPNQSVAEGDLLFELERTMLASKLEVAKKALDTARAELDQASQQAIFDPKAKGTLAVIRARVEERSAEVAQLEELLARAQVQAPRGGVAVLDDPTEWQGRPVVVGEKVLAVASPHDVEVEAWLAPADVIQLEEGGPVSLFLNADPLSPVSGKLRYITYEAIPQADGTLGHRVRAELNKGEAGPRLGLKGTVRLDGRRVPLIYWLGRRPLAIIRTFVGL